MMSIGSPNHYIKSAFDALTLTRITECIKVKIEIENNEIPNYNSLVSCQLTRTPFLRGIVFATHKLKTNKSSSIECRFNVMKK